MFVTELIKDKKYRHFLLSRFPKPKGTKTVDSLIQSSSIIGYAFEIYFKLQLSKTSLPDVLFDDELSAAKHNISWLENRDSISTDQKGVRIVYAERTYLKYLKKLIAATFEKKAYKFVKANGIVKLEVSEKNALNIFIFQTQSKLFVANSFHGNKFVIFCKEDVLKEFNNCISKFKKEVKLYKRNVYLTSELLLSILQIANISNQFFIFNPIIHTFTKSEIRNLRDSFKKVLNPYALINIKSLFCKPSLTWQNVRARPDFILNNFILELKTGKAYLSTEDYLQGITYLLFSYQNGSRKKYGKIEKLEIYYPFISRVYSINARSIKLSHNDNKTFKDLVLKFSKHGRC